MKLISLLLFYFSVFTGLAQLDTIHWLPPLHSIDPAGDVADHYVYISTPSTTPFNVTITDGNGTVLQIASVSNSVPYRYYIGSGQPTHFMVSMTELNTALPNRGLIVHGKYPFYANLRVQSALQAEHITANGRAAQGTLFRAGVVPMQFPNYNRNFVLGMMATQATTHIRIFGYDTAIVFAGSPHLKNDSFNITLNKGECYVLSGYADNTGGDPTANYAGFTGASIVADNPIVIDNGNFCGSIENNANGQDIMAKQAISVNWLGNDYIVIRGGGTDSMEKPLVIAQYDSTIISVNCKVIDTIMKKDSRYSNIGKYRLISASNYSAAPAFNMYIHTSKPAYVYQCLGADSSSLTASANTGLDLIPPLNCGLPHEINQMDSINYIGKTIYNTDLFAFTTVGSTLTINGVTQTNPSNIPCLPGWVTYRESGLTGNVKVVSTGPMGAGVFGYNNYASFAGYFSGFGVDSSIHITASSNSICDTSTVLIKLISQNGTYDTLKWYLNGVLLSSGSGIDSLVAKKSGTYQLVAINGSCAATSDLITIKICQPPQIIIPNVFTPNADGKNDLFEISNLDNYPGSELEIYNRWGNLIYKTADYKNDWNGTNQGNNAKCSDGMYYYVFKLGVKNTSYKGFVELLRNGS